MFDKFLKYLWLTGLHYIHPLTFCFPRRPRPVILVEFIYCYGLALLTVVIGLLGLADYTLFYLSDIVTLDFFVLTKLINTLSICLQIPIIYLIYSCLNGRIAGLLHEFAMTMAQILTSGEYKSIEKRVTQLCFVWVGSTILIMIYSISSVRYHWTMYLDPDTSTSARVYHIVTISVIPGWGLTLFNYAVYLLCVNVDGTVQIFYVNVALIFYLAAAFRRIRQNIQTTSVHVADSQVAEILAKQTNHTQLMRNLTGKFNDTFGLLVTLNCIRDLIAIVVTIAIWLEVTFVLLFA